MTIVIISVLKSEVLKEVIQINQTLEGDFVIRYITDDVEVLEKSFPKGSLLAMQLVP